MAIQLVVSCVLVFVTRTTYEIEKLLHRLRRRRRQSEAALMNILITFWPVHRLSSRPRGKLVGIATLQTSASVINASPDLEGTQLLGRGKEPEW